MVLHWSYIADVSLLSTVVIVQIVALILLRLSKDIIKIGNQRNIIYALCVCELTGAVFLITFQIFYYFEFTTVSDIISCFTEIFIVCSYFSIMLILTADRFLIFYLSLTYKVYVRPARVVTLIIIFSAIFFIISTILATLVSLQKITWEQLGARLTIVYVTFDGVFFIFVLITYCYVFMVYRRQKKVQKSNQHIDNGDRFKLWVPSLIIATFIMFNLIPDLYIAVSTYGILYSDETKLAIAYLCYRIGWLVDPVIYIFSFISKKEKVGIAQVSQKVC